MRRAPRPATRLPRFLRHGLAFVDIETTGGPPQRESITEIGIIEVDEGCVREWSSLVRPEMRISPHIEQLTGISNEMVAHAPTFAEIADMVFDRLDGRLFVAHNARFDHGYLRAAFRRLGVELRPRVLCTVRLSRRLFPEYRRHSLDHLIARHRLDAGTRHRALGDARLLWQFWQHLYLRFPPSVLEEVVRALVGRPSLPPHLEAEEIERIPDGPGVYLLHGENDLPLYIGKSRHLRARVLAHFCGDHLSERALELSQQVRRVSWIETAGELGALLKEAELVKQLQPTHNRHLRHTREACAWRLAPDLIGDWQLQLVPAGALDLARQEHLYGFFRSRREALARLRALAREHALCPPLLGLERHAPGRRCFSYQVGRCRGACHGEESAQSHALRLIAALEALKVTRWPFAGPAAIRELDAFHIIDGWRYLGTAAADTPPGEILACARPPFDPDIYRILRKVIGQAEPLAPHCETHGTNDASIASQPTAAARRRAARSVGG